MEELKKGEIEQAPRSTNHQILSDSRTDIDIKTDWVEGEDDTKILSLKFNHDDKFIAAACDNGKIQVFNTAQKSLSYVFEHPNKTPYSYVKWRPKGDTFKTKNVFVTCNSDGEISHYHLASNEAPGDNKDAQLFTLDYDRFGTTFAVAGSKPWVNIYDEETKTKKRSLGGDLYPPGHSLRIYCVKFDPFNENILYSGGWDKRVVRWDLRMGKPDSMGITGPLVCGDGIDIIENHILTASWRENDQLQIWDPRNLKLMGNIDWSQNLRNPVTGNEPCYCYAAQFSKNDGSVVLAGGSNSNEVKLFDRYRGYRDIVGIFELTREVDCLDFSNGGSRFAISGGDGYVRVFELNIEV